VKQEEIRQVVAYMESLKEQIDSLGSQMQLIQESINDFSRARDTAQNYVDAGTDTEIMIPVGGGVYLPGKVLNTGKGFLYSSAGYTFEEPITKIVEILEKRIKELADASQKIYQKMTDLQRQLESLQVAVEEGEGKRAG